MPEVLSKKWRGRLIRYAPLIFWIGLIFFLSSNMGAASNTSRIIRPLLLWLFPDITEPSIQAVHYFVRKAAHITEYAVLALLGFLALRNSSRAYLKNWRFPLSMLLVLLVSLTDEINQSFLNSRTGSIYDSLLDCSGGLTLLLILWLFTFKRSLRTAAAE